MLDRLAGQRQYLAGLDVTMAHRLPKLGQRVVRERAQERDAGRAGGNLCHPTP
jgi:hypothetical protein